MQLNRLGSLFLMQGRAQEPDLVFQCFVLSDAVSEHFERVIYS